MPHSATPYYGDSPHTGGYLWLGINDMVVDNDLFTLVRNALGNWSKRRVSGGAETYNFRWDVSGAALSRLLEAQSLLEQFGGATVGGPIAPPFYPGSPEISGSAVVSSISLPKKGFRVKDVTIIYRPTIAALTSLTASLNSTVLANNAAPVVTNLPVTGALATAVQAQPYVTKLTVTTPAFIVTDNTDVSFETAFVLQNGTILDVWGVFVHVDFNYN